MGLSISYLVSFACPTKGAASLKIGMPFTKKSERSLGLFNYVNPLITKMLQAFTSVQIEGVSIALLAFMLPTALI